MYLLVSAQLSVNINKVATLRNSRGADVPALADAIAAIVRAGCKGITVHPRADERHITRRDIFDVAACVRAFPGVEYNIEGDPRPELMRDVLDVRPDQCTLVPVRPGEVTSEAGWDIHAEHQSLRAAIEALRARGIRVSLFVDAAEDTVRWAHAQGAQRVELYTEPFARAFSRGPDAAQASMQQFQRAASLAHELGLEVNAGHDLDLDNLLLFRELQPLHEVSIGHALISRALFVGLDTVVREYLDLLATG